MPRSLIQPSIQPSVSYENKTEERIERGGQVLVLHGGIGDGSWGLDELRHKVF